MTFIRVVQSDGKKSQKEALNIKLLLHPRAVDSNVRHDPSKHRTPSRMSPAFPNIFGPHQECFPPWQLPFLPSKMAQQGFLEGSRAAVKSPCGDKHPTKNVSTVVASVVIHFVIPMLLIHVKAFHFGPEVFRRVELSIWVFQKIIPTETHNPYIILIHSQGPSGPHFGETSTYLQAP